MAITEREVYGSIEVLEDGQIQLRKDTIIEKDGKEIHRSHHREVLEPGQDLSAKDARIQAVANALWTQDVKDEFAVRKAERDAKLPDTSTRER